MIQIYYEEHKNVCTKCHAKPSSSCVNLTVINYINVLSFLLFLQNFYLWKKDKRSLKDMKEKDKELLIQVNKLIHTHTSTAVSKVCGGAPLSDPSFPIFISAGELLRDFHHCA